MTKTFKNNKVDLFIKIFAFALFIILAFVAGYFHEPWADEAQSWLIARDNDFFGIIKTMPYEGSPAFWHLLTKLFILCGLKYEYIFVIPLIVTSIGVYVLLFKIDFPLWAKLLIVFSFYTVYQVGAISRSYSAFFTILMFLVITYNSRFEKPFLFLFPMVLLATTSLFGLVVSGSYFLLYIAQFRINVKDNMKKRVYLCLFLLAVSYLLIVYFTYPAKDSCMGTSTAQYFFNGSINQFLRISYIITTTFLTNINNSAFCILFTFLFVIILIFYFNRNIINAAIIVLPLLIFLSIGVGLERHFSTLYFTLISALIIFKNNCCNKKTVKNVSICILLTLLSLSQVFYGFCSINNDVHHNYSGSKDAADLIKQYYSSDVEIVTLGYYSTSILPYFDDNIYTNRTTEYSYFLWSKNSEDNIRNYEYMSHSDADIYVFEKSDDYSKLIENTKNYKLYVCKGDMFFKDFTINNQNFYVYINKDLIKQ